MNEVIEAAKNILEAMARKAMATDDPSACKPALLERKGDCFIIHMLHDAQVAIRENYGPANITVESDEDDVVVLIQICRIRSEEN